MTPWRKELGCPGHIHGPGRWDIPHHPGPPCDSWMVGFLMASDGRICLPPDDVSIETYKTTLFLGTFRCRAGFDVRFRRFRRPPPTEDRHSGHRPGRQSWAMHLDGQRRAVGRRSTTRALHVTAAELASDEWRRNSALNTFVPSPETAGNLNVRTNH